MKKVLQTVQNKTESYRDIVKQSCKQSVVTTENIRVAVKSVNEKEDGSENLFILTLAEDVEYLSEYLSCRISLS